MASTPERTPCVSWFIETNSGITTQRRFQTLYGKPPPPTKSIRGWHQKFLKSEQTRPGAGGRKLLQERLTECSESLKTRVSRPYEVRP